MPSETDRSIQGLQDILENIDAANEFVEGMTFDAFKTDRLRIYAVTRSLEIISEASRLLSETTKARNPSIPWQQVVSAGNLYRHEYRVVATAAVWTTLTKDLPTLRAVVLQELAILTPPAA